MRAIDLVIRQLDGVHGLYHEIADDLTDREWTARVFPGSSRLGFTLWHLPRTQDWAVQTLLRGAPEVIADARWQGRGPLQTPGMGAGFTPEEADELAHGLDRADVLDYADAVHQSCAAWLRTLTDDDLDTITDMPGRQTAYPEYQRPEFLAEVQHLIAVPTWRILLGPCIGHVRSHLGELEVIKQALRTSAEVG